MRATVNVCETFVSIQGESTYAGLTCFFIRLSGCNLRCGYCDTAYAFSRGRDVAVTRLVRDAAASRAAMIEITGGEPLLQPGFRMLAQALRDGCNRPVAVETNGSVSLVSVPQGVSAIMDVKCPGSGEQESTDPGNLMRLRSYDEVKFVLSDRADYEWAKAFLARYPGVSACRAVLFAPARRRLSARRLCGWIVEDGLHVRLQVPLHGILGAR